MTGKNAGCRGMRPKAATTLLQRRKNACLGAQNTQVFISQIVISIKTFTFLHVLALACTSLHWLGQIGTCSHPAGPGGTHPTHVRSAGCKCAPGIERDMLNQNTICYLQTEAACSRHHWIVFLRPSSKGIRASKPKKSFARVVSRCRRG